MKIELWSDYICPYCYISNVNFEKAFEAFPRRSEIELIHHAFQLLPDAHYDNNPPYYETLASASQKTIEEIKDRDKPVLELAKRYKVPIDFEKIQLANTAKAHKLTYLAEENKLQHQWVSRVFKAYFVDGLNIADEKTLKNLALEVGLPVDDLAETLNSKSYEERMHQEREEAYKINFATIPYYLINGKTELPTTLGPDEYLEILQEHI